MVKKINISGKWKYIEDFGYGIDTGYAIIKHEENSISGIIKYTEQIEGDITFMIKQKIKGNFDGFKIKMEGFDVETLPMDEAEGYNFDTWEGNLESPHKIVGKSIDESGISGEFTFIKEVE